MISAASPRTWPCWRSAPATEVSCCRPPVRWAWPAGSSPCSPGRAGSSSVLSKSSQDTPARTSAQPFGKWLMTLAFLLAQQVTSAYVHGRGGEVSPLRRTRNGLAPEENVRRQPASGVCTARLQRRRRLHRWRYAARLDRGGVAALQENAEIADLGQVESFASECRGRRLRSP